MYQASVLEDSSITGDGGGGSSGGGDDDDDYNDVHNNDAGAEHETLDMYYGLMLISLSDLWLKLCLEAFTATEIHKIFSG
jgi:hypothetical protein